MQIINMQQGFRRLYQFSWSVFATLANK